MKILLGIRTGLRMASATTMAMMMASKANGHSCFAGLNAMATAAFPHDESLRLDGFDAKRTPLGLGLLTGGLVTFGIAYESILARLRIEPSQKTGAALAAVGYALDRMLLPRHLLPNFRAAMGPGGTFAKYAAMARIASH